MYGIALTGVSADENGTIKIINDFNMVNYKPDISHYKEYSYGKIDNGIGQDYYNGIDV